MLSQKANIIAQLQKEILSLGGSKILPANKFIHDKLGVFKNAFANESFPLGAVHEFICDDTESTAATGGFIAGILGSLMQANGISIWISPSQTIFPPALTSFGISPEKLIFINLQKEKEIHWAMEEALKCDRLTAVIGEMKEMNFTTSRRLQLSVEQSRVTGFIMRNNPQRIIANACVTRWKINSLPGELIEDMQGVGFPAWNVELLKVRNGIPSNWQIEFVAGRFRRLSKIAAIQQRLQKKTG
jgi:protein ImuA